MTAICRVDFPGRTEHSNCQVCVTIATANSTNSLKKMTRPQPRGRVSKRRQDLRGRPTRVVFFSFLLLPLLVAGLVLQCKTDFRTRQSFTWEHAQYPLRLAVYPKDWRFWRTWLSCCFCHFPSLCRANWYHMVSWHPQYDSWIMFAACDAHICFEVLWSNHFLVHQAQRQAAIVGLVWFRPFNNTNWSNSCVSPFSHLGPFEMWWFKHVGWRHMRWLYNYIIYLYYITIQYRHIICFRAPCPTCYFYQQWTKLNCITFPSKQHQSHPKLFCPSVRIPHHHLELKNWRVGVPSFPLKTEKGDEVAGIKPEKHYYFQHIFRSLFFRGWVIGPFIALTQTLFIDLRDRLKLSLKYTVYNHSL